jgi:hypothetical protein
MDLIESVVGEERRWQLVAMATGALAGLAVRQALQKGWHMIRDESPPENPAARRVGWGQALAWTVATSVAMGVGQLVAERGAAAGWRKVRGRYPKGLD